ncbi:MAG TPA: hypothetical protein VH327_04975 [Gammaproteobacteria bacterium]|nr:hypothetical protein [Gammaproteobacteria bacterium]
MNGDELVAGLSRSPDCLWQEIDFVNRRGLVVKFDEEGYRRASFLDHRAFLRDTEAVWLPFEGLLREAEALPPPPAPHAIFHVSHCGSTLVSRLTAELPDCLPVRESLVALGLAVVRRDLDRAESRLDAATWDALFDTALRLLSRTYRPGQRAVLKFTSACGNLVVPVLQHDADSKALLLHTDLETWLTVMLRDENVRHNGRFYAQDWLKDLHALTGRRDLRLAALNDPQQFAVNWLAAMLQFERAVQQYPQRTQRCDFEPFLADPATGLKKVGDFFGLDTARAAGIAAGPLLKSYAKNPAKPFDRAARERELEDTRQRAGAEIRAGLQFAEKLCNEIAMLAPLGAYLTRSSTRKE